MITIFLMIEFQVGMRQHYELGKFLRQRYAKLLGNGEYSADKVYVYSTVGSKESIPLSNVKSVWMSLSDLLLFSGYGSNAHVRRILFGIFIPTAGRSNLE